jgi:hypothetical protein
VRSALRKQKISRAIKETTDPRQEPTKDFIDLVDDQKLLQPFSGLPAHTVPKARFEI